MDDYVVSLSGAPGPSPADMARSTYRRGAAISTELSRLASLGSCPDAANGHRVTTAWVDWPSRVYRVLVPVQVFPSRGCRIYVSHWCGLTSVAANSLLHRYAVDTGT